MPSRLAAWVRSALAPEWPDELVRAQLSGVGICVEGAHTGRGAWSAAESNH